MFESINEVETAVLYIICGLILIISNVAVFTVFICYRELRHGIYGMVLGTISSEIYLGLHALMAGAYSIYRNATTPMNMVFCKLDAMLTVFFWTFWTMQNFSIMILFKRRKLEHSKLSKVLFFLSITTSFVLSALLYINDDVGISFSGTCFINKNSQITTAILSGIFYFVFIATVLFNIWFLYWRDPSKDRNFINGYNYFLLITTLISTFTTTYTGSTVSNAYGCSQC
jgi:hypothetical protein